MEFNLEAQNQWSNEFNELQFLWSEVVGNECLTDGFVHSHSNSPVLEQLVKKWWMLEDDPGHFGGLKSGFQVNKLLLHLCT